MSKSACRLARVLCGIWFKTVDAIIVRMTQLSLDDPGQHFGIDGLVREGLPVFAFFLNRLKKLIEGLRALVVGTRRQEAARARIIEDFRLGGPHNFPNSERQCAYP
jgi:hypothetical protein